MPNIRSAKKRVKVAAAKRARNKMVKSEMKTAIKKVKIAIDAGDRELANNLYREAAACIDKAAKKGVIHRNNASNKKSGLSRLINNISDAAS